MLADSIIARPLTFIADGKFNFDAKETEVFERIKINFK